MIMLFRFVICIALMLAVTGFAQARGESGMANEQPVKLSAGPINFYLAKGEPDACGPGCSEWIAAEGYFDPDAAERFRMFMRRLRGASRPIFFSSPGGIQEQALSIGRLMRLRGMTAGVAITLPDGCDPKPECARKAGRG
jgi:hypothetical protein